MQDSIDRIGGNPLADMLYQMNPPLAGMAAASIDDLARREVLSAEEMVDQYNRGYAAQEARLCADTKAAYDAQNPHKRREV